MSNKKITDMDAITTVDDADVLPIVDQTDITTKKITVAQIKAEMPAPTVWVISTEEATGEIFKGKTVYTYILTGTTSNLADSGVDTFTHSLGIDDYVALTGVIDTGAGDSYEVIFTDLDANTLDVIWDGSALRNKSIEVRIKYTKV